MPRRARGSEKTGPVETPALFLHLGDAMKKLLVLALLSPLPVLAQPAAPAKTYVSAAQVEAFIAEARAAHKPGNTVKILVSAQGYPVQLEYRSGDTPPTAHPLEAELIEVVGGGCTFVMGGTLAGRKPAAPGANTVSGTAIEGGTPQVVGKGDYIMVPANTPHWYKDVRGELVTVALHMPARNPARP
jgi:hypothetical protein